MTSTVAPSPPSSSPPPPTTIPDADAAADRSYFRSVAVAWLIAIPVITLLVTTLILAVGDVGTGGAIAIGVFAGIWAAPLGAVGGVGYWAAKHQH